MLQVDNDPIVLGAGSPSGAYLSSVSTDSSLRGNGTVGSPLSAAPLVGVATPTTATPGYLGQVVFDTNGKCWMLRKIDGSTYSWERLFTDIVLTQTEYDAIVTKDPNARYMIVGA